MDQHGSILSKEFSYYETQRLDVRDLIDQSRSFIMHIFPFIKLKRSLLELLSWKNFFNSFLTLILGNLIISSISNVVFLSSMSFILIFFILFGLLHRKTGILKKVFPTDNLEEFINLPHNEAMHDFHIILVVIDNFVRCGRANMLKFYAILRWENLAHSILTYSLLSVGCIILSICSFRFFILFIFNIMFSFYPILFYILNETRIKEDESNHQDILIEETLSRNSEQDAGFGTESESSVQGSNSSEEEQDEERKSSIIQDSENIAVTIAAPVGERVLEEAGSVDSNKILSEDVPKNDIKNEAKQVTNTKVNAIVGKLMELKKRKNILHSEKCNYCGQLYNTILRRKNICSNCGNHFCSKCCSYRVPRSKFGATAPAAQTETASVCLTCFDNLNKNNYFKEE